MRGGVYLAIISLGSLYNKTDRGKYCSYFLMGVKKCFRTAGCDKKGNLTFSHKPFRDIEIGSKHLNHKEIYTTASSI